MDFISKISILKHNLYYNKKQEYWDNLGMSVSAVFVPVFMTNMGTFSKFDFALSK